MGPADNGGVTGLGNKTRAWLAHDPIQHAHARVRIHQHKRAQT